MQSREAWAIWHLLQALCAYYLVDKTEDVIGGDNSLTDIQNRICIWHPEVAYIVFLQTCPTQRVDGWWNVVIPRRVLPRWNYPSNFGHIGRGYKDVRFIGDSLERKFVKESLFIIPFWPKENMAPEDNYVVGRSMTDSIRFVYLLASSLFSQVQKKLIILRLDAEHLLWKPIRALSFTRKSRWQAIWK